jgi:hypothetical protein
MFPKAESTFSRCAGAGKGPNDIPLDPESRDCWIMFYDRHLLERRQTASFDKRQLEQLNHELREFRGPKYEGRQHENMPDQRTIPRVGLVRMRSGERSADCRR